MQVERKYDFYACKQISKKIKNKNISNKIDIVGELFTKTLNKGHK